VSRALALAFVCIAALGAASLGDARSAPRDYCLQPGERPVHLHAADGATIYGVQVGSGTTGVVFGHQFLSDHCEWMDFARELARLGGFRAIAIDFRGNGFSRDANGPRLDLDVAAAAARLRAGGARRIVLLGSSMGGTAVLVAASRIRPAVDGVVSLSGPARYGGMDALAAVERSHVPVLFLADRKDGAFALDAQRLYRAAAARDKTIALFADGLHGHQLLALPKAKAMVLAFLRKPR
jgi:pimeloyl-ACP methyl ester carboxylesterase